MLMSWSRRASLGSIKLWPANWTVAFRLLYSVFNYALMVILCQLGILGHPLHEVCLHCLPRLVLRLELIILPPELIISLDAQPKSTNEVA